MALISVSIGCLSQSKPSSRPAESEKIRGVFSAKTEYIRSVLDLSQKEADTFWPIYNNYLEKREMLSSKKRSCMIGINKYLSSQNNMTEKNIKTLLDLNSYYDEEIIKLDKNFYLNVQKVLSLRKQALLFKAEEDFRVMLIQQLKGSKL